MPHTKVVPTFQAEQLPDGILALSFEGEMTSQTIGHLWQKVHEYINQENPNTLRVDMQNVNKCDTSGIAFLESLQTRQVEHQNKFEILGLPKHLRYLFDEYMASQIDFKESEIRSKKRDGFFVTIGEAVAHLVTDLVRQVTFIGELIVSIGEAILRPSRVRWGDVVQVIETSGINALPIIALIGFLVGLIMAFQGSIPMRMFGADIFVADLVAFSVIRELGPLITAIILAGRTGSAFAAEIGTMKVNEEINALNTMGLNPVRFLVVSRVIAVFILTPLLTVFADLAGMIGGAVVFQSFGYPLVTYLNQITNALSYMDFLGGLIKALVFGLIVSSIGCMRGLETQTGASAVGRSATRAVVSGIILIVITDGVFSVVYYLLGI